MSEFMRASNGETWAEVEAGACELYPKIIEKLSSQGVAALGGVAQKIIEQSHAGEASGAMIAAPAFELRLLMYFASKGIVSEMAAREKAFNEKAARASQQ